MKSKPTMLERLILECEIDERIETGIFDVYNVDHLRILVEHMVEFGMTERAAEKLLESELVVDEGKYPDRQAYNKEGWLVTFPSKEYRDRAIKKGTHSVSDPTHGKGGMNLYYKKKGKQKRQTQQDPTATQPEAPTKQPVAAPQPAAEKPQQPAQAQPQDQDDSEGYVDFAARDAELEKYAASKSGGVKAPAKGEPDSQAGDSELPAADEKSPTEPAKPTAPAAGEPATPATPPPPPYAALSKEFAASKGWKPTEYGEYRNGQGDTVAVVGLTGEVVPVKSVFRDEFKLFVNKRGYG